MFCPFFSLIRLVRFFWPFSFISIGFVSDVCSGEELPEVEIFSLLEEQIPKYKLRADTLTSFAGKFSEDILVFLPFVFTDNILTYRKFHE